MSYRSLSRTNERYQLTVFWVLLAAFLFAWAMMFVHPSVTLLTFWLGLIFLGGSALFLRHNRKAQEAAAKSSLEAHDCPWCGAGIDGSLAASQWHCQQCGADFLDSGVELTHGR